jgi:hypothetical protein
MLIHKKKMTVSSIAKFIFHPIGAIIMTYLVVKSPDFGATVNQHPTVHHEG